MQHLYKAKIVSEPDNIIPEMRIRVIQDEENIIYNMQLEHNVDNQLIFTHPALKETSVAMVTFWESFNEEGSVYMQTNNGSASITVKDREGNEEKNYSVNVAIWF